MKKIMIDAGHGGRDPGAVGPSGVQEKVVTLVVAKQVTGLLALVTEAKLTRDGDIALGTNTSSDLTARANMANNWGANCFISIHCNSAADPRAHGTEVYHYPNSTQGAALAQAIHSKLVPALGLTDRGVKQANFAVLRQSRCPAALVELAFISNPTEENLLETPAFQAKAARAIAEGTAQFLGLQLMAETPASPAQIPNAVKIRVGNLVVNGIIVADDRTYAPVRAFGEALGMPVVWDAQKGVTIGGVKVEVRVIGGTSYAPVRYLAETLGKSVTWDGTKVVII